MIQVSCSNDALRNDEDPHTKNQLLLDFDIPTTLVSAKVPFLIKRCSLVVPDVAYAHMKKVNELAVGSSSVGLPKFQKKVKKSTCHRLRGLVEAWDRLSTRGRDTQS